MLGGDQLAAYELAAVADRHTLLLGRSTYDGSLSLVRQLSEHRLVDEYQLLVRPVALGGGTSMFAGMSSRLGADARRPAALGQRDRC